MKVRDVMTSPVVTVAADATFAAIVDQLLEHDISGVPVVDDDGGVLGMVTEADLVSKQAYGFRRRRALGLVADYLLGKDPQWVRKSVGRTAAQVMTASPVAVAPDDDVTTAARWMLESHLKRLPVVADGRLVGIVSRHDLLKVFHRPDAAVLSDITEMLGDVMRVPETHDASAKVTDGVVLLTGSALHPSDVALIGDVVSRVPGVIAVDNALVAREREPSAR